MHSLQKIVDDAKRPRVHIKYEVETAGRKIEKELPFVVGVMGDFSGNVAENSKSLRDRKFIAIDKDNFDEVMRRMNPKLNLLIENKLGNSNEMMAVELQFNRMEDFEPDKIVLQVPELRVLLETRNQLREMVTRVDRSDDLEIMLEKILKNSALLKKLIAELEI